MSDLADVSRRLVAVFAADVEGYSRLMGNDEVGTLKGLTERRAILDRLIGEHRGRIANTAGDSVLAEFGSAVDAVKCAVDAQAALAEANTNLPSDRRINYRMGVHIGDVMVRAGDLFGDGVNIAARLQTLAKPGSVCISAATYDQVRKLLPLTFVDLGAQEVKNIQEPIRVYQAGDAPNETREVAHARFTDAESPPLPEKPSIAVLPIQNISGDPEQEYFADGIVEEIITALSRFKWLFVIARNSSFTFKGKAVDIKEVGRRLGVRYVLEGSVRKAAGKVRITGQLIDAMTGAHIWADKFERDLTDIFALQDEVTVAVVSAVQPKLLETEVEIAERRRPENLTAHDLSLRARKARYLFTREGMGEAIRLAHQSLDIDPRCILAAVVGANAHLDNVTSGFSGDPQFDRNEAIRLSRLALSLDENDERALSIAAWVTSFFIGDHETAIDFADRAVACNPNDAVAWRLRGWTYKAASQYEEAIRSFELSIRLSPLDPGLFVSLAGLGQSLVELRRFDDAVAICKKALRQNPLFGATHCGLASALAHLGRDAEAREAADRLLQVDPAATIAGFIGRGRSQTNSKVLIEGLRKAGLPE
jgi:adenylate cyclase